MDIIRLMGTMKATNTNVNDSCFQGLSFVHWGRQTLGQGIKRLLM
jgi:hypothetical protein